MHIRFGQLVTPPAFLVSPHATYYGYKGEGVALAKTDGQSHSGGYSDLFDQTYSVNGYASTGNERLDIKPYVRVWANSRGTIMARDVPVEVWMENAGPGKTEIRAHVLDYYRLKDHQPITKVLDTNKLADPHLGLNMNWITAKKIEDAIRLGDALAKHFDVQI